MSECIFCRIVSGEIPAQFVHRDEEVVAIQDVDPKAPVHLLVMPRLHRTNVGALGRGDAALAARLLTVAAELGARHGPGGYRLTINTGPDGGQTVDHLHIHVLAGRHMTWPPG